jgi:hypothetical protein
MGWNAGGGRVGGRWAAIAVIAAACVGSSGCRPEERDRPVSFTPGNFQGEKTQELTATQTRALQERGNLLK